jgi:uncharacterized damage-inducible protein DinB
MEQTSRAGAGAGASEQGAAGYGVTMLRTMFDYSIWARDKLLGVIEGLEDTRLRDVPGGSSGVYGSIFDTLAHMAASEWLWIQRCIGESPLRSPRGEDFRDLRTLVNWWNSVHADSVAVLSGISEQDLDTQLTYLAPDGKRRTRKVWHMLLQVPNHQTEHRSQLATMLGQLGIEVPQTDLVVYLSEQR